MWAIENRPKDFTEVIGQDRAISVIKKSLGKFTNYILYGDSGVGKTTLARIIGSELGAEIIEINGADNNGVNDVRGLVDSALYVPAFNPYRLFIIDEAHMLTTQAWNAMLKILEEAPDTTVWVLCTTEYAKIPLTIKSRALSVKLAPIGKEAMVDYLTKLAGEQDYDPDVLEDIVARSEGRMREALSAWETYLTTKVRPQTFSTKDAIEFIKKVFDEDVIGCSEVLDKLANEDVKTIVTVIADYLKFLLIIQADPAQKPVEVLRDRTTISPRFINDLRTMQNSIGAVCPYTGDPKLATVRFLYDFYDLIMAHYNDFRDSRQSFTVAVMAMIERIKR